MSCHKEMKFHLSQFYLAPFQSNEPNIYKEVEAMYILMISRHAQFYVMILEMTMSAYYYFRGLFSCMLPKYEDKWTSSHHDDCRISDEILLPHRLAQYMPPYSIIILLRNAEEFIDDYAGNGTIY